MGEKGEEEIPEMEEEERLPAEEVDTLEETEVEAEAKNQEETVKEVAEEETLEMEEIEGEAPPSREEGEEFVEERIYTIPLRRAWIMPPKKRAPKAMRIIKAFVQRHMKVSEAAIEEEGEEKERGRIIVSNEVNEKVWSRGIEKPPRKIRIRAAKDEEGNVTVFLS